MEEEEEEKKEAFPFTIHPAPPPPPFSDRGGNMVMCVVWEAVEGDWRRPLRPPPRRGVRMREKERKEDF